MSSGNIIVNYNFLMEKVCASPYLYLTDDSIKLLEARQVPVRNKTISPVELMEFLGEAGDFGRNGNEHHYLEYGGKNSLKLEKAQDMAFCFKENVPIFLDVNAFLKTLIMSSGLVFRSQNEKICLAVMADRRKIGYAWTVDEIIEEASKYIRKGKLQPKKIRECLERHCGDHEYRVDMSAEEGATLSFYSKNDQGKEPTYTLRLTELIFYFQTHNAVLNEM